MVAVTGTGGGRPRGGGPRGDGCTCTALTRRWHVGGDGTGLCRAALRYAGVVVAVASSCREVCCAVHLCPFMGGTVGKVVKNVGTVVQMLEVQDVLLRTVPANREQLRRLFQVTDGQE